MSARTVLLLLAFAVATRLQLLGNPILYSDEQFYALAGARMLEGAIPYVDIWDRKPVGLFVLYALFEWLGRGSVLGYQLAGTLFAAATALLVVRIALEFSTRWAAVAAGLAYLALLNLGAAGGGQAPLFYNLPICASALITMRALQGLYGPGRGVLGQGLCAMLLAGVAMQIKYSAVFEGIFFGLVFLIVAWRQGERSRLPYYAGLWVGAALLPTIVAAGVYAAIGHFQDFMFANFYSVLLRGGTDPVSLLGQFAVMAAIIAPFGACALRSPPLEGARPRTAHRFVLAWLGASIFGVLIFGTYFHHYVLPVMVPAAAGAAAAFGSPRRGSAIAGTLIALAAVGGQAVVAISAHNKGSRAEFVRIAEAAGNAKGCLFVYAPYAALYRVTGSCIPTRFAFSSHLARVREKGATGVDQVAEVRRIMASRPETVVVGRAYSDQNRAAWSALVRALQRDYRLVLRASLGRDPMLVFRLKATTR